MNFNSTKVNTSSINLDVNTSNYKNYNLNNVQSYEEIDYSSIEIDNSIETEINVTPTKIINDNQPEIKNSVFTQLPSMDGGTATTTSSTISYTYKGYTLDANIEGMLATLDDSYKFTRFYRDVIDLHPDEAQERFKPYVDLYNMCLNGEVELNDTQLSRIEKLVNYYYKKVEQPSTYIIDDTLFYKYNDEELEASISGMLTLLDDSYSFSRFYRNVIDNHHDEIVSRFKKYAELYNCYLDGKVELNDKQLERLEKIVELYNKYNVEVVEEYEYSLTDLQNLKKSLENALDGNLSDEDKSMYEYYIKNVEKQIKLYEYSTYTRTSEYKDFIINYNCHNSGYSYDKLLNYDFDVYMYEFCEGNTDRLDFEHLDPYMLCELIAEHHSDSDDIAKSLFFYSTSGDVADAALNYPFMTEDQINMVHYLYAYKGKDAAEEYINAIMPDITMARAVYNANNFIETLDLNDKGQIEEKFENYYKVSIRGFITGNLNFYEGLGHIFDNSTDYTESDLEKMIVIEFLKKSDPSFETTYEFSSTFGNMAPALVASAITTAALTPAAGTLVGSGLMGLSAGGNAKHQALIQGSDLFTSTLYGIFIGTSEAALGYFLGKIPGISKVSGFALKNLLSEGAEEYLQEWIDAGLQAVLLHQDVDWNSVPDQAMHSFIMGVCMSGFLNGGQAIVGLTINGVHQDVNVESLLEYINNNPDADIETALAETNPSFFDLFRRRNTQTYNYQQQYTNIENASYAANNCYTGIRNELAKVLETKNWVELRKTSRAAIDFLVKTTTMSYEDAMSNVVSMLTYELNNLDYNSYIDTETGIEFIEPVNIDHDIQPVYIEQIQEYLQYLPPEMVKLVKKVRIYDTFNPADFFWEYKYGIDDFRSGATGGNGEINFWVPRLDYGSTNLNTLTHEIAHTLDLEAAYDWGIAGMDENGTYRVSSSQEWLEAMWADKQLNGLNGCTEYAAQSNSSEDFAEAVALYYTNPNALDSFPNRKAFLEQYLPKQDNIANAYDLAYDSMVNKYGEEFAMENFRKYAETGDINLITRDNGAREMISKYSVEEFKNYLDTIEMEKVTLHKKAVSSAFSSTIGSLVRNYGADTAALYLQQYIDTGNINYIPEEERANIAQFDVEEYRNYILEVNGSLDLMSIIGG